MDLEKGKITIGLPVYNAEKFLKKRIEGLLSQTFQNFEITISDNFSTDSTKIICEEYVKKDPRIKNFEQKENLGWQKNFKFVLEKSNSEFFIWTASNDIWDDTFLEKNLEILKKDLGIIGSTSKIIQYGEINTERKTDNKLILMTKNYFSKYGTFNAKGTYDNRILTYLSVRSAESIYSLFRTDILKKSFVEEEISVVDLAVILNVLKFGEIHVINEVLFQDYVRGTSSKGIITTYKNIRKSKFELIFPYFTFTKWYYKNLEKKIFFKNFDNFLK